jgi:hypothetical protein
MTRTVSRLDIADPTSLTQEVTVGALQGLKPRRLWPWQRCGVVIRTFNHAKAWISTYLATESVDLDEQFVDEHRYYTMHLLIYGNEEVRFVFRLHTRGLEGWTEYGIGVAKVGEDFACWE